MKLTGQCRIDFDYEEFVKGIQLPEGSTWKATII